MQAKSKCRICRQPATRRRGLVSLCASIDCEVTLGMKLLDVRKKEVAKKDRSDTAKRKEAIKSRSDWLRECQVEFNRAIRLRDQLAGYRCISCDTSNMNVKMNAGHFASVGAHPELRFEPLNVHLQCEKCNSYLSGNISAYRPRLIERIGADKVEWLEGRHEPKRYTIDDLKRMKAEFKAWNKELGYKKENGVTSEYITSEDDDKQ